MRDSRFFSLQLDESTDLTKHAQLLGYVRYEAGTIEKPHISDELLFCESLEDRTTAESIFSVINTFIKSNNISWTNCVGMCTDGCPTMLGAHGGLRAKIRQIAPHVKYIHCMIHRQVILHCKITKNCIMTHQKSAEKHQKL